MILRQIQETFLATHVRGNILEYGKSRGENLNSDNAFGFGLILIPDFKNDINRVLECLTYLYFWSAFYVVIFSIYFKPSTW